MNKYHPGEIVTFTTTNSDLSIFNGTKCKISEVKETEDGDAYNAEFISPKCLVFESELSEDESND